jgi:RHS repeat-associated protein
VSELLYDSPLTPPSSAEVNKGEYVTLRNTSGIPIPLRYVKLRVPSHGSYRPALSYVEGFSSTDTVQPDHSILVAYGTGTDSTDLRLADNLPAGLFSDPTMHLRTQTSMTLPDAGGSLQLYEDVSGFETLLENISFGGSGILAANAHCDTTCQADTARPEVQAVQLIDYTDTYTYDGVPYEAREAKGKGKDGETYYTVKAVTGRKPGGKEYELKEEGAPATDGPLTRVVISDIKHSVIASGVVGSFNADVKVMRDYYAFGMEMPGQIWQAGGYRYGFNGMERDDELKGQGASYDFGARMFDPRIGRWLSKDPRESEFTDLTPYAFASNSSIAFLDPDGEENIVYLVFLENQNTKTKISKSEKLKVEKAMDHILFENTINAKAKMMVSGKKLDHSKLDKTDVVIYYRFQEQTLEFLPELECVHDARSPGEWFEEEGYGIVNLSTFGTKVPPGAKWSHLKEPIPILEEWKEKNKSKIAQLEKAYGLGYDRPLWLALVGCHESLGHNALGAGHTSGEERMRAQEIYGAQDIMVEGNAMIPWPFPKEKGSEVYRFQPIQILEVMKLFNCEPPKDNYSTRVELDNH